jgi:hypothetical protein
VANTRNILLGLLTTAILAGLALFAGSSAEASVTCSRYASPNGNDNSSGSLEAPFRTAQRLVSSLQPGETGCLRQGTYTPTGTYVFTMPRGGTPSAPITVTSYPGERATIQGITQIPAGANYVTLSDMNFEGSAGMQTVKIYSTGVHVENNDITNNWSSGSCMMLGSNSAGQALQPVISGNVFHGCGSLADGNKDHGIYAANVMEGRIVNNLFFDTAAYAIQLYPNAQRTTFAHNVINGSAPSVRGGLVFGGDEYTASSENVVEQNVIAFATTYDITTSWGGATGSGNVARNNCLYGGGQGNLANGGGMVAANNLNADPRFVDSSADDFRLESDSACLDVVGYDTVAMIEAGGVKIPDEGGTRPPEGGPVGEPPATEQPTLPPVTTPPVVPPRSPGSGSGSNHGGSSNGGSAEAGGGTTKESASGKRRARHRRVSIRAHRVADGTKVAVRGRVAGARVSRSVKVRVSAGSGWSRTVRRTVSAHHTFAVNLRVPKALGNVSVRAFASGVGRSPVANV